MHNIWVILGILATLPSAAKATTNSCRDLFSKNLFLSLSEKETEDLRNLKVSMYPFEDVTMEQVKLFSSNEGSLQVFVKSPNRREPHATENLFILVLWRLTNMPPEMHSQLPTSGRNLENFPDALNRAHKKGDWTAKKRMIQAIKTIEPAIAKAARVPRIDLLRLDSWLYLFGAKNLSELVDIMNRAEALSVQRGYEFVTESREKVMEIMQPKVEEDVAENLGPRHFENYEELTHFVIAEINGPAHRRALSNIGLFKAIKPEKYPVEDLIAQLHLSQQREDFYKEVISELRSYRFLGINTDAQWKQRLELRLIYIFELAYMEKFPERKYTTDQLVSSATFLTIVRQLGTYNRVFQITEQRLEENLQETEKINARVELILGDAQQALASLSRSGADANLQKRIEKIMDTVTPLHISDINVNMDFAPALRQLDELQLSLHEVVEKISMNIQNKNITHFSELNFSWDRLLPDHPYQIEGKDYDRVVFDKHVIDDLKRDPDNHRFLGALDNRYVNGEKQSGLLSAPVVHKDLRYIKLLRHGSKIRIVGVLLDGAIYFFHIHRGSSKFDISEYRKMIKAFVEKKKAQEN